MESTSQYPQHPLLQTALSLLNKTFLERESVDRQTPEDMVSEALNQLTLQERIGLQDEVLGIADEPNEDNVEFVEDRLRKLEEAIMRKTQSQTASSPFNVALRQYPSYVRDKSFLLKFLRAESFDPDLAATRLLNYFEFINEYFGASLLGRPITLEDLSKEDIANLKRGKYQLLRSRDNKGRVIVCDLHVSDEKLYTSIKSILRVFFYMLYTLADDLQTSRKGVITLIYYVGDIQLSLMDFDLPSEGAFLYRSAPIRFVATHMCMSNKLLQSFASLAMKFQNAKDIQRAHVHWGSTHIECRHSLMSCGIPIDHIPVTEGGQLKTKIHLQWLRMRRIEEEAIREKGSFAGIDFPMPEDVLGGRGRTISNHSGNMLLKAWMEEALPDYNSARKHKDKAEITGDFVRRTHASGGRFLERSEEDGFWYEVSDDRARYLLTRYFQNLRVTSRKTKQPRQEITQAPAKRVRTDAGCLVLICGGGEDDDDA